MLHREFTKKEIALILILVALLLAAGFYQFVYKDYNEKLASFDTTELENELATEVNKAASIKTMKAEMEANKAADTGVVETYNNLKQEITALNDILASADTFNLGFDAATAQSGDDTVRRNIQVTFTSSSYADAEKVLQALHDCKYRCIIKDLNITPSADKTISDSPVQVSLTVTFFETLYNATTTDGLLVEGGDASGAGDTDLTDDLASSKTAAEDTGSGY